MNGDRTMAAHHASTAPSARAAAPALMACGLVAALGACSGPATTSTADASAVTTAATGATDTGTAGATGTAVQVVAEDGGDPSCADGDTGYHASWYETTTTTGGAAAVGLYLCDDGSRTLETDPAVTVLDADGAAVQVAVEHEAQDAAAVHEISAAGPMCLVLTWTGSASTASDVTVGEQLQIGAAGDRAAFTVPVATAFEVGSGLTVSQWVAASGAPSSCLGSN